MVTVLFNGQSHQVKEDSTITDLLSDAKVEIRFCAVELNLEIVSKDQYLSQRLKEGDQIEVVTLVGGG